MCSVDLAESDTNVSDDSEDLDDVDDEQEILFVNELSAPKIRN